LIFLGTPHVGSPKSYFVWEGGTTGFDFADLFLNAILRQEAIEAGFGTFSDPSRKPREIIFDYIHSSSTPITSIQELLPMYDYLKDSGTDSLRSYPNNYPVNAFLESLNASTSVELLGNSNIEISNLYSNDQSGTLTTIIVEDSSSTLPLWEHGIPKEFEFGAGDRTVPSSSAVALNIANSTNINVGGVHRDLPGNSSAEIVTILTGKTSPTIITTSRINRLLSIFGFSPIDILITAPDGKRIGKNFATGEEINEIDGAFYTGFNTQNENIFIPDPLDGEYAIETEGTDTGSYGLLVDYIRELNPGDATSTLIHFTANTETSLIENLSFDFNSSAPEVTAIIPEDITSPTITHTLLDDDYVVGVTPIIFNFSGEDTGVGLFSLLAILDGTPLIDGDIVGFDQIGNHQIEIVAEDFVGNMATEIISFNVVYSFGGFLPPIKDDGSGVYKLGRTIPIKFQLTDMNGQFISTANPVLTIRKISSGILGDEEIELPTISTNSDDTFRYDEKSSQYIYNLSTGGLPAGTWEIEVSLDDNTAYKVIISIK